MGWLVGGVVPRDIFLALFLPFLPFASRLCGHRGDD